MTRDGFLINSWNRRLGKRVIHSESINKKLLEVKKVLENKPVDMEIDTNVKPFEFNGADIHSNGHMRYGSTFGGLHSIGSYLTCTRLQLESYQHGSVWSGQVAQTKADQGNTTPTSRAVPISSLESGVAGKDGERMKGMVSGGGDDSHSTQDKHPWRVSMLKDHIQQYMKYQKSQSNL